MNITKTNTATDGQENSPGSSNLTSSYKFTPTNNIIASSSLLRSTGDVSLEIY